MPTDPSARDASTAPADPIEVVCALSTAWAANDVDTMLSYATEDCIYTLYIDESVLAFAGQSRGKTEIRAALTLMRSVFEYILYRPFPATADGNRVRQQVEFIYKHRASGEELSGRFRLVWTVENGLVTAVEEYHDRARIEAFGRMVAESCKD